MLLFHASLVTSKLVQLEAGFSRERLANTGCSLCQNWHDWAPLAIAFALATPEHPQGVGIPGGGVGLALVLG